MSMEVTLTELAGVLERYAFAYLATVQEGRRTHIVAVRPALDGDVLRISKPGRTTNRNVGQQADVTLVWPPTDDGGYSLIVDGTAMRRDEDHEELVVTPTHAVLHRPAQPPAANPAGACGSDCAEVPVSG